ncbi:unnamed protein product [Sphagnum compactum]
MVMSWKQHLVRSSRLLLNAAARRTTIHEGLWQLHGSRGLASDVGSQGRGSPISSKPAVEGVESIIAVASGKGGAGKSTTAGKKKKWGLSVLVLLLPCAATFGLGTWQLYRRNKKIELLDYRRKRLEEEPVLLEIVLATSKGSGENFQSVDLLEYRRVVIQGKYDNSKSLFVGPRVQTLYGEAKKGYQMVTPFICQSQITEAMQVPVLVNRGWVPASMRDEFLSRSHQETDNTSKVESHKPNPWWNWWNKPTEHEASKVTIISQLCRARVVGVIRDGEHPNMFVPHNQPEIGQWFYVDVPAMAQTVGLPPDVTYIEAVSTTNGSSKTFPLPKEPDALLKSSVMPQDHLNYSLTWYSLAAATTFMAVKRLQSQKRGW